MITHSFKEASKSNWPNSREDWRRSTDESFEKPKGERKDLMKGGLACLFTLVLAFGFCGCSESKQSKVEGKLVDWNGKPVAGVKIIAQQVKEPIIKGYEKAEAVTGADGTFRLKGLFPSSRYVLKPWSDKWTTDTSVTMYTAPHGETAVLQSPMVIEKAYPIKGGSLVLDLATGATRFMLSSDGVITDSTTGLEWIVGPDRDMNYSQAQEWVAECNVRGGGWRMPTRQQLKTLYQKGAGEHNIDPLFKIEGIWVWAEPRDSSTAWYFVFNIGLESCSPRNLSGASRVFGVRSRPR